MMYSIKNWSKYQHYKDRNPPWIKLHFELLTSPDWVMLDDASRVLSVAIMLIASRNDGRIDCSPNGLAYLKRVAYLNTDPDISPLVATGFLVPQADACGCKQMQADVRPETETEAETEAEAEERRERERRACAEDFNALYQSRPSGPLMTAEGAYYQAIEAGATHEVLMARWPEYCRRQEKNGLNVPHLANWLRSGGWADSTLDEDEWSRSSGAMFPEVA